MKQIPTARSLSTPKAILLRVSFGVDMYRLNDLFFDLMSSYYIGIIKGGVR